MGKVQVSGNIGTAGGVDNLFCRYTVSILLPMTLRFCAKKIILFFGTNASKNGEKNDNSQSTATN